MITIGIDVGITGAIAFIDHDKSFLSVWDMPTMPYGKKKVVDPLGLRDILIGEATDEWRLPFEYNVFVEQVSAMPNQGVTSMFNFGMGYGTVLGVLGGFGINPVLVRPQTWKKPLGLIGKDKDESRLLAQQLYPAAPLSRKKDHGRADALLIAHYGL